MEKVVNINFYDKDSYLKNQSSFLLGVRISETTEEEMLNSDNYTGCNKLLCVLDDVYDIYNSFRPNEKYKFIAYDDFKHIITTTTTQEYFDDDSYYDDS